MKKFSNGFKKKIGITVIILTLLFGGGFVILYNLGLTDIPFISELPKEKQIRVSCVGDSVTYGYGIRNWEESNYPAVLQNLLGDNYHVMNFGMSGHCVQNTSDEPYTSSDAYEMSLNYDADIVVFMLGSNDSKVYNWKGADVFRDAYLELLDDYKDSKIILCTPSTAYYTDEDGEKQGITTFEIQPAVVEEIADIVRDIAKEYGYTLIDINDLTSANPQWFSVDGTHPDENGAYAIANAVYDTISNLDL